MIDQTLDPMRMTWEPVPVTHSNNQQIPPFCGIDTVSRAFTLNKLQHAALAVVSKHLLQRWKGLDPHTNEANIVSDQALQDRQLLFYLGGEGGTGKSRVIRSLQELCKSWQKPDAVVLAAMTGKAASIIGGRTLASVEMILKSASGPSFVRDVDCLIVDEISMLSKYQLLKLDRALRKAKRIGGVPFGGLHVVLVGDFFQLPPVGADPLYISPGPKITASLNDFEGFELWRAFRHSIILEQSVRFHTDPEWDEGCSRARYGDWTPEFVRMINARLIGDRDLSLDRELSSLPCGTVFVTPDNSTRTAINGYFIPNSAKWLPQPSYPIRVVANFKGALKNLSRSDVTAIMDLSDTKFGRMAPFLDLVCGMPIQITQNLRTKKGVANGTMGHLRSVCFPMGTTFSQVRDPRNDTVVWIPSLRPLYAIVSLERGPHAVPICEQGDPSLFPVFPNTEAFSKTTVDLTPNSRGEPRRFTVKIQQFPFVCAVAATVYKVQGESLQSMAVVDWKADIRGANKPQQAYLMVSRVVNRQGFICLKPFTSAIASWSKPPARALEEDHRLRTISDDTLRQMGISSD